MEERVKEEGLRGKIRERPDCFEKPFERDYELNIYPGRSIELQRKNTHLRKRHFRFGSYGFCACCHSSYFSYLILFVFFFFLNSVCWVVVVG